MAANALAADHSEFGVLAVMQGQWGERIADNVGRFHPSDWTVQRWSAPRALPLVLDEIGRASCRERVYVLV